MLYQFFREMHSIFMRAKDPAIEELFLRRMAEMGPEMSTEEAKTEFDSTKTEWSYAMASRAYILFQAEFLRVAALLKNSSFEEEQEGRLVLPLSTRAINLQYPLRFRDGATTLVPYVEFPLPLGEKTSCLSLTLSWGR